MLVTRQVLFSGAKAFRVLSAPQLQASVAQLQVFSVIVSFFLLNTRLIHLNRYHNRLVQDGGMKRISKVRVEESDKEKLAVGERGN